MAANRKTYYSTQSPYADTGIYRLGLDVMRHRAIPRFKEDKLYKIEPQYNYRPDLLAFDLYGTAALWWVFTARNPSVLKDPTFDFRTNQQIFLSTKSTLVTALGL